MRGSRRIWLTLLALALALLSRVARAEDPHAEAAAEMQKAQVSVDQHDYQSAIGHYLAARALAPESSGPYLGLGLAYAALGRCDEAIPALEEYLRRKKTPHPSAATTLATCRAQQAAQEKKPLATVRVPDGEGDVEGGVLGGVEGGTGMWKHPPEEPEVAPPNLPKGKLSLKIDPVGGVLMVNGTRVPGEPRTFEAAVRPGLYQVEVDRVGYDSATASVWVRSSQTSSARLVLGSQGPRETRRKLGIALGVIIPAGVVAAAIALGIVYGTPPTPARFGTVMESP